MYLLSGTYENGAKVEDGQNAEKKGEGDILNCGAKLICHNNIIRSTLNGSYQLISPLIVSTY